MPPFSWASHASHEAHETKHTRKHDALRDFDSWRRNDYRDARRVNARLVDLWVKAMMEVWFADYGSHEVGKLDFLLPEDMADMIQEFNSSVSVHSGGITLLYEGTNRGKDYNMYERLEELGAFGRQQRGSAGVSHKKGSGGGTASRGSRSSGKTNGKKRGKRG